MTAESGLNTKVDLLNTFSGCVDQEFTERAIESRNNNCEFKCYL